MHIVLVVFSERFDLVLLQQRWADSPPELEPVAVYVERVLALVHVPFLLDLGPDSRVARKL